VLVDEVHVVDRRFMKRISRAGISRMQPFQIEVSTAGNNPDGYGKARWDYGKKVEAGDIKDQSLFFAAYEAPQDVSDEDLDADPVKYGKLANPAWGHTIDEDEYLADYQSSKQSISDLADFKMYRLNVWQQSVNPWLRSHQWNQCGAQYTLDDMLGRPIFAGLDLSKTEDMTALVLATAHDGLVWLWPMFWMPEATARRHNHLAPFVQWAHDGLIELTPGDVVDYAHVEAAIGQLHERYGIAELVFDRWHGEELTQRLENLHGIKRAEFAQSITNFAKPTAEFERRVIAGTLRHPRHPVLTWQANHASVKTDQNGNKRPVKPVKEDIKKIDGIVGAIMALSRAMEEDHESVYSRRGVILL
jgi:phage terminase large subunit-like protein